MIGTLKLKKLNLGSTRIKQLMLGTEVAWKDADDKIVTVEHTDGTNDTYSFEKTDDGFRIYASSKYANATIIYLSFYGLVEDGITNDKVGTTGPLEVIVESNYQTVNNQNYITYRTSTSNFNIYYLSQGDTTLPSDIIEIKIVLSGNTGGKSCQLLFKNPDGTEYIPQTV